MSHIHTKLGEHDVTSSAFIVRFDTPKPQLLLHQHKSLGKLLQPGGHVELTENPWQSVLREITEETGYELSQLQVLQPKDRLASLANAILHPVAVCVNTHDFGG
jgi:8-oxo-dGTP pyrophosphatase MutT (NUDIX family)